MAEGLAAANDTGLPLLFGPRRDDDWAFKEQLALLRLGDVVTYCFSDCPEGLLADGRVRDEVWAARERGIHFDVGHGMGSFSFRVAEAAIAEGFLPDTISTDRYQRHLALSPRHDLPRTLSKLLAAGMTERDAFLRVTARPATILGLGGEVGTLAPGSVRRPGGARLESRRAPAPRHERGGAAGRRLGARPDRARRRPDPALAGAGRGARMTPSRWDRLKNDQTVLAALFLLPTLLVLLGVVVYPFCSAVWISFQAKQAGTPGRFIGLQNYAELLGNEVFLQIVGNTIFYTGVAVAIKFTLGLLAALVLAPERRLNGLYRTVLFVPWAVPTVIAALNWRWVYDEFSGMLNNVLLALGLTQNVVAWLAEPRLAMWCVIAVAVWTGTPFYTMSFLAGLQAIPKELYEAARLDGASTLQEFLHVTVPGMQAIFLVTVMLSTVFTSTSLVIVNVLTNGAPAERTNILPNFSFNLAMGTGRLGIASAVNMIFFPLLILVILGLSRRLLAARAS